MQYARHRPLREAMYRAYATRASELGPHYGQGQPDWDNTSIIVEQLALPFASLSLGRLLESLVRTASARAGERLRDDIALIGARLAP